MNSYADNGNDFNENDGQNSRPIRLNIHLCLLYRRTGEPVCGRGGAVLIEQTVSFQRLIVNLGGLRT